MRYSGDRFINVAKLQGFPDSSPLPDRDLSYLVRSAVTLLMRNRLLPGGTVYLRPGRWRLGGDEPLVIPEEIELMLAPGAMIIPLPPSTGPVGVEDILSPSLEIYGSLDAGPGMFIATPASEALLASVLIPEAPAPRVGWVSFPTRALDAVSPDWWGAGTLGGPEGAAIDTDAFEAAVRSATFREPWSVVSGSSAAPWESRPLAIDVRAPLRLNRRVALGQRPWTFHIAGERRPYLSSMRGLVLRGDRRASPPHVIGARDTEMPSLEMVSVNAPREVRIEALSFDLGEGFLSALTILLNPSGERAGADVVDCVFTGSRGALVAVGTHYDFKSPSADSVPPVVVIGVALPPGDGGVIFDGCAWSPRLEDPSFPTVGLSVTALDRSVTVRDGRFAGEAARMISMRGGNLRVNGTVFANTAFPVEWFDTAPELRSAIVDVGLDIEIDEEAYLPLGVDLNGCTSSSIQFLGSFAARLRDRVSGLYLSIDYVDPTASTSLVARVVAVHHEYAAGQRSFTDAGRWIPSFPPAIHWGSFGNFRFQLTIIGSRLVPTPASGAGSLLYSGMVTVDTPGAYPIYDAWLLPAGQRYTVFRGPRVPYVYSMANRLLAGATWVDAGP